MLNNYLYDFLSHRFHKYIQNSDYTGVYGWNLFYSSMLKGVYLRK